MRTALGATRATGPDDREPEAELVVVDARDDIVRLELDDGACIDFDRIELLAACQARAALVGR